MTRSELREHVFKMLFQIEFNDKTEMSEHLQYYCDTIEGASEKNREEIQKKYEGVISHMEEIDRLLNDISKGWKTSRMNKVDLTILRLAVYVHISVDLRDLHDVISYHQRPGGPVNADQRQGRERRRIYQLQASCGVQRSLPGFQKSLRHAVK